MTEYRRFRHPGATWFFTVNLAERRGNRLLTDRIDLLRVAFSHVKAKHPYEIDAIMVLPDHLHCILTLPDGDSDFSTRWGLIKAHFSRHLEKGERISKSRAKRGERGVWQRRFWEHLIRDEADYRQHIDYIHWNPVRHGWTQSVKDWPYPVFTAMCVVGRIQRIEVMMPMSPTLRWRSDANDAVRTSPHPTGS